VAAYPPRKKNKAPPRVRESTLVMDLPESIQAGEFKARCLALMDLVRDRKEELVITKHGKPVAKLVPVDPPSQAPAFGALKGSVVWYGDLISPIDAEWEIEHE